MRRDTELSRSEHGYVSCRGRAADRSHSFSRGLSRPQGPPPSAAVLERDLRTIWQSSGKERPI